MNQSTVLGIPFSQASAAETLQTLRGYLDTDRNHVVATPNPEAVMLARSDDNFRKALLSADLRLPDGVGIVWAARRLGVPVAQKVGGCDTALAFFDHIKNDSRSVFLLGAAPGVAQKASEQINKKYPGLRVVGWRDGYYNREDEAAVAAQINAANPDVLILGLGMPKQEIFAHSHRDSLGARVTMCLGGTIDVLAGVKKRPPLWMRRIGLEWLGTLFLDMRRIGRMMALPRFVAAVLASAWRR